MTWDVPVKDNCPSCGQTMFKLAGRGARKPFCINPDCPEFVPEDKRGYRRKPTAKTGEKAEEKTAESAAAQADAAAEKHVKKAAARKKAPAKKKA